MRSRAQKTWQIDVSPQLASCRSRSGVIQSGPNLPPADGPRTEGPSRTLDPLIRLVIILFPTAYGHLKNLQMAVEELGPGRHAEYDDSTSVLHPKAVLQQQIQPHRLTSTWYTPSGILCSRPSHDFDESGPDRHETGGKNLSILPPRTGGVVNGCCDPPKKHFAMNTYGAVGSGIILFCLVRLISPNRKNQCPKAKTQSADRKPQICICNIGELIGQGCERCSVFQDVFVTLGPRNKLHPAHPAVVPPFP
jgi:hypothetical protein